MSKKEQWDVRLGSAEWARFARPQQADQFRLLGSVRRGASMGALAITPSGRYLQVNGDYVSELNSNQVDRAVQIATSKVASSARLPDAAQRRGDAAPVVVIKRRRLLASA